MRALFALCIASGLIAACSADRNPNHASKAPQSTSSFPSLARARAPSAIAASPDRGALLSFGRDNAVRVGASTWRAVQLSEEHALHAIGGVMTVSSPHGSPIRLQYTRHVEHPDGSWTWIGRPIGAAPGNEAIVTFGEKAVFGSIPDEKGQPLQLTTAAGRSWMVEVDAARAAKSEAAKTAPVDYLVVPELLRRSSSTNRIASVSAAPVAMATTAAASASLSAPTVDVVLGYTSGFATRLGGRSQALTRLNFLVDLTNQAYINSRVPGQLRLVQAVEVAYPDATTNRSALFQLSGVTCVSRQSTSELPTGGVNCSPAAVPAELQPLLDAREQYGADLVSLVRKFESPENQSCGIGWMLGGGQASLTSADADLGLSVVSDSSGKIFADSGSSCRDDALAHELGHNMGLQHDREVAQGSDDTNSDGDLLDPEEYGRYPYAFGYTAGADAGNFYTIMAILRSGRTGYRVFSSPRVTMCGGFPCGVAEVADAARAIAQTIPIVASFRASTFRVAHDFNGDGRSDILWRNGSSGANVIWESADSESTRAVSPVAGAWIVAGTADFSGDGRTDVLWRNATTGANVIWRSANSATQQPVSSVSSTAWKVAATADFDGDGRADILWHNASTGANIIWKSANSATPQQAKTIADLAWNVAGAGDFDGDGRADVLWRNGSTGANVIWRSANAATPIAVRGVTNTAWKVAGIGDFNLDGRDDIVWHNDGTGGNAIWASAMYSSQLPIGQIKDTAWRAAEVGDFNGDGVADILWRHVGNGSNLIWLSANGATPRAVTTVANLSWTVAK
jgi:peptidyl-Asp metalloendopeptidase